MSVLWYSKQSAVIMMIVKLQNKPSFRPSTGLRTQSSRPSPLPAEPSASPRNSLRNFESASWNEGSREEEEEEEQEEEEDDDESDEEEDEEGGEGLESAADTIGCSTTTTKAPPGQSAL